ncbi:MAG: hypothetical protein GTN99_02995, partial [Candidatus Dadabacteria bacterium]|nr:hypothetical protein [Candidatus Dadabacteria bacterium]NIT13229.1 hypothetical protein [Candidatus Dadabacteria bacterium]
DGKTFLDEKKISLSALGAGLKEKADKKSLIIIRADNDVEHGKVVRVMDIIKTQDFSRIAIAVDTEPPAQKNQDN